MKPISAARRFLANTDRLNELVHVTSDLAHNVSEKLDRLQQGADNQSTTLNEALGRLQQGVDNQSTALNAALDGLQQGVDNQSTGLNAALDRLQQGVDNQSTALNAALDRLQQAVDNQSGSLNEKLGELIAAITNQSASANLRIDRLLGELRHDTLVLHPESSNAAPNTISDRSIEVSAPTKGSSNSEWLKNSPSPLPLPRWSNGVPDHATAGASRVKGLTNRMRSYQPLLDALEPWQGQVPKGYLVDFLGILTDAHFRTQYGVDPASAGGVYTATEIPSLQGNGEWWFEVINWLEASREAHNHFVMMTLGACYGAQAVGAYRTLQIVNPMPCTLVAVEPEKLPLGAETLSRQWH